mmetsp:Transcript_27637/g.49875  ORF Transcript_27637/g.49875 Transcript_27637/m.49875 type:complete len:157 (-) Transcript_27637:2842-3312(-)
MIVRKTEGRLEHSYLTEDHKPTRPDEKLRIEKHNGEVRKLENDLIHRLFLKGKNFPGIAVSRAFGDTVAASAGLSCEPEVGVVDLTEEDCFVMIASDGIWEFMDEQDILKELDANSKDTRAAALVESSWQRWLLHEDSTDDMTVLLLALKETPEAL